MDAVLRKRRIASNREPHREWHSRHGMDSPPAHWWLPREPRCNSNLRKQSRCKKPPQLFCGSDQRCNATCQALTESNSPATERITDDVLAGKIIATLWFVFLSVCFPHALQCFHPIPVCYSYVNCRTRVAGRGTG